MKQMTTIKSLGAALVATSLLAGCASSSGDARLTELEQELRQARQANAKLAASLKDAQTTGGSTTTTTTTVATAPAAAPTANTGNADLPPNAVPGECYARVLTPATYGTKTETVVVREAAQRVEIIPATYRTVEQKVLVKEAWEEVVEVIPATYKTIEETVVVREPSEKMETVPAQYKTVEEKILVKPGYTTWKAGRGPIEKVDNATGEIMCLVEIPAEYKTVKKKVLVTAESTRRVPVPAKTKVIKKRVMATPPQVKKVTHPPVYKTVKVTKVDRPAQEKRIAVPAKTKTVTREVVVSDSKLNWTNILCETNVNKGVVSELQRALKARGFNPGPIDGVYGRQTMAAVKRFQQAKGLSTGGLTLETLDALGIRARR